MEVGQGCRFPCGQVTVLIMLPKVPQAVHQPGKRCPNPLRLPFPAGTDSLFLDPGLAVGSS